MLHCRNSILISFVRNMLNTVKTVIFYLTNYYYN